MKWDPKGFVMALVNVLVLLSVLLGQVSIVGWFRKDELNRLKMYILTKKR